MVRVTTKRRTNAQVLRNVFALEKMTRTTRVKAGIFGDKRYPNGTPVALVAAVNEYGNSGRPARPAWREAMSEGKTRFAKTFARGCKRVISGKGTPAEAFDAVGVVMKEAVKKKILEYGIYDTGRLYRSVGYKKLKIGGKDK